MSLNVLIIDDSLTACKTLEQQFNALGVVNVDFCWDGRNAIRLLKKYQAQYQIVVVDLHMPNMDGIELLTKLKGIDFKGGVIIASAMEERIIQAASQVVINSRLRLLGSLSKPVTSERLKACIDRLSMMTPKATDSVKHVDIEELREAIKDSKIIPYYQAQMDATSGKVKGFEILCRVQVGEQLKLLTPDSFIQVAEKHNLLNILMERLLTKAIEDWQDIKQLPDCKDVSLSFNLSPNQLTQFGWPKRLFHFCETNKIDTQKVTVEITENQALDKESQHSCISRLRMHKFGVALDDFGTGYTNLSQLRCLPISELKLDISLVKGISKDPLAQAILGSMQEVSKSLNITLVAEGVEDIEDYNYLEGIPNLRMQGYLICRPKPFSEMMRWLKAHSRVSSY